MKRKLFAVSTLGLALVIIVAAGCQTVPRGAGLGGALGAGTGAIIGHQSGRAIEGAVIGGVVGAAAGAIEGIVLKDDVELTTIGGSAPVGLCGSGLIDLAAELLHKGILLSQGLFATPDTLPETLSPALRSRLIEHDGAQAFVFAHAGETQSGVPLVLTQRDVREFQLATAAIRSTGAIPLRISRCEVWTSARHH